ncbi:MAG: YeeE/YedE thiosulfate transporter family protein [Gemmatimonadota bacterium]|nr:YeeE/YedE thiosulfate transporter family protein [Gemmatimonadota bacterium]
MRDPWPWYVAGPLIGLVVPALLLGAGKAFGVSTSFRDICAAVTPGRFEYLNYDWRSGAWRLAFVAGIALGGALAVTALASPDPVVAVSEATRADLAELGIRDRTGLFPEELMSWEALGSLPGLVTLVLGGFLVGFGTRWADGCTSGHAIMGLVGRQLPSLLAVLGFFAGGLISTFVILPLLLGGGG